MKTVFWDLDSTIASTAKRWHLIPEDKAHGNWVEYSSACEDDDVLLPAMTLLRLLHSLGVCTVLVSGRTDAAMEQTRNWLAANDVPYDYLILRRQGVDDGVRNAPLKIRNVRQWLAEHPDAEPVLMVDDYLKVAEAFHAEADLPPVLIVNPCYPEPGSADHTDDVQAYRAGLHLR